MSRFYIGVDIGGTEVKTALVDENDKAVFAQNIPTESEKRLCSYHKYDCKSDKNFIR